MNARTLRNCVATCAALAAASLGSNSFGALITGIGVQFVGNQGSPLTPSQSAGVVPQANYNALTGNTFSSTPLNDSSGNLSSATLSVNAGGTYGNGGPSGADQTLNSGLINGTSTYTFTVNNVPWSSYSLIVYELDNAPRTEGTVVGSSTPVGNANAAWLESPSPYPGSPGYTYLQGTSNDPLNPTVNGDYVEFTKLGSSTLTFTIAAPGSVGGVGLPGDQNGNMFVTGFQIVNTTPEPSTFVLGGLGLAGLLLATRKRRRAV